MFLSEYNGSTLNFTSTVFGQGLYPKKFDVSNQTCSGDGWEEEINSWDVIINGLDDIQCGKCKENMKCVCVAYFSPGTILPPYRPKFHCESCNEWYENNGKHWHEFKM